MTESLFAQTVATATGLLMLTAVLRVWRRSTDASTRLLAVQGAALALLVGAIGLAEGHAELVAVAVVVFALKGVLLPWVLARTIARSGIHREDSSAVNPVSGLLAAAGLATAIVDRASVTPVGLARPAAAARARAPHRRGRGRYR